MPEAPEVRRYVDSLQSIIGLQIVSVTTLLSSRYFASGIVGMCTTRTPDSLAFPVTISSIDNKGKFIYWTLQANDDHCWVLLNSLGMTGGWQFQRGPNTRVIFHLSDGNVVCYDDARNYGTLKFAKGDIELNRKLRLLGSDMLQHPPDVVTYIQLVRKIKPNRTLAEMLMDQRVVSGVGNYIKSESLYVAGLSPHRLVTSCTDIELTLLHAAIIDVCNTSYKSTDMSTGQYGPEFAVYGRKHDPQGRIVVNEITLDKRTSWWVPEVQK